MTSTLTTAHVVLATDAATVLPGVAELVAFEPPLVVDPDGNVLPEGLRA